MEWKPIEGSDGNYLISSNGKVFSVQSEKILKPHLSNSGYYRIELRLNGVVKKHAIHRLVAEAFIPNPNNYPIINHKDENPKNNDVSNLEWCTYKYNSNYGTCIERMNQNRNYHFGKDNHNSREVYQFDLDGNLIAKYESTGIAEKVTGVNNKDISKCALGKLKRAGQYVWSYDGTFHYDEHKRYLNRGGVVYRYSLDYELIAEYESPDDMRADGLNPSNVNRVIRGERKTYMNNYFTRNKFS